MLSTEWDTYSGSIPEPTFVDVNVDTDAAIGRHNFQAVDLVLIQPDVTGEQATPRDTFRYWDFKYNLILTIITISGRQRLHDIKQEIRRILIYKMHDITNNSYQLVRYGGFTELVQEELRMWKGQIRVTFEDVGKYHAVETP